MRYWDDMNTKYGFNDGAAVPYSAPEYRRVYITFINERARRYRSKLRCVAYDRPGMHNHCLILIVPAKHLRGIDPLDTTKVGNRLVDLDLRETGWDKEFGRAMEEAHEAGLDDYVEETAITKMDELDDLLANMDG